ncbi:NUDIX hydrolase [Methylocella silvestris]|uniref:NUDIX hydrolase n=1 Tax=Methylocella silvestris TaxID=199596 RepID=A0A2J7TJ99_METSI|nr:NUDIX hydrolase [Methylocella silvestris]PNG26844.1 NUDIX hydrolase [Methylocella silvestris]
MSAYEPPRIEEVDELIFKIEDRGWAFASDQAAAIDRHWQKLREANSHLFNGRVFLNFERVLERRNDRRVLSGVAAAVDFKAFLAWRDFGFPDVKTRNCFAMAALVSADGAFMLGRMSDSTANAGKIYFPAGTPDLSDVVGDQLDLEGSVARELLEETGIAADEVAFDAGWRVVFEGPRIACMKITRSPLAASEIEARFRAFARTQEKPEFSALHPVYSKEDLVEGRMPDFTLRYLRSELSKA